MQRIPSIWVCITTKGVIQNGSVFRYPTHTLARFYIGVAPLGVEGVGGGVGVGGGGRTLRGADYPSGTGRSWCPD